MLICKQCERACQGSDFYASNLATCKACIKENVRKNYAEKRAQYSKYDQERAQRPERKAAMILYQRARRAREPEKYKARTAVKNAIRDGRLVRLPCKCGNPKSQAHHHDYSKPLDVEWLCFKCHREDAHQQVVTCDGK